MDEQKELAYALLTLTIIADPTTGLPYESARLWNDAAQAFRNWREGPHSDRGRYTRRDDFRPLQDDTRAINTPDGCTVGENAAWLLPGEYVQWDASGMAILASLPCYVYLG